MSDPFISSRLPKVGDIASFNGKHGYDFERKEAEKLFGVGEPYWTVREVEIGGFSSCVKIGGCDRWWNSVLFDYSPRG